MSIYSNVTDKDLINVRKLAEQQKNQRALKIKNRILKQTHDLQLAESLTPITKKLDEVNDSTKKVGEVIKESNSENEDNKEIVTDKIKNIPSSILLQETLKSLAKTSNSLKLDQDKESNISILGIPIKSLGGDKIQVNDNVYEVTPEIHKALSLTKHYH